MNRNGALGLIASGTLLVIAALFLLPVGGLSLIAGAVGVLGILVLVYGGIV